MPSPFGLLGDFKRAFDITSTVREGARQASDFLLKATRKADPQAFLAPLGGDLNIPEVKSVFEQHYKSELGIDFTEAQLTQEITKQITQPPKNTWLGSTSPTFALVKGIEDGVSLGYLGNDFYEPEKMSEKVSSFVGESLGMLAPFALTGGVASTVFAGTTKIPQVGKMILKHPKMSTVFNAGLGFAAYEAARKPKKEETRLSNIQTGAIIGSGIGAFPFFAGALWSKAAPIMPQKVKNALVSAVIANDVRKYKATLNEHISKMPLPTLSASKEILDDFRWRPNTWGYQNAFTRHSYEWYDRTMDYFSRKDGNLWNYMKIRNVPELFALHKEKIRIMDGISKRVQDDIMQPVKNLSLEQQRQLGEMIFKTIPVTDDLVNLTWKADLEIGRIGTSIVNSIKELVHKGHLPAEMATKFENMILPNIGQYARSFYVRPDFTGQAPTMKGGSIARTLINTSLYKRRLRLDEWGRNAMRMDGYFLNDDVEFALSWRDDHVPLARFRNWTIEQVSKMKPSQLKKEIENTFDARDALHTFGKIINASELLPKGKKLTALPPTSYLPNKAEFLERLKKFKFNDVKKFLSPEDEKFVAPFMEYAERHNLNPKEAKNFLAEVYEQLMSFEKKRITGHGVGKQKIDYYDRIIKEAQEIVNGGNLLSMSKEELEKIGIQAKKNYGWVTNADALLTRTFNDLITEYGNIQFLGRLMDEPSLYSKTPVEGFVQVRDLVSKRVGEAKLGPIGLDDWVHPGMRDEIEGLMNTSKTPVEQAGRQLLRLWKLNKVGINPPTIVRNFLSSHFIQTDMAGFPVWNPKNFKVFNQSMFDYWGKKEGYKEARDAGLFGSDYFSVEIGKVAEQTLKKSSDFGDFWAKFTAMAGKKTPEGIKTFASGEFYGMIDHSARFYLYNSARQNGATPRQAVFFANKWQLDYRFVPKWLDSLRKGVGGAMFPFMSFYALMLPRTMEVAATRPWVLWKYPIALNLLNRVNVARSGMLPSQAEALKPQWLAGQDYVVMTGLDENNDPEYLNFDYIMPFGSWKTLFVDATALGDMTGNLGLVGSFQGLVENRDPFTEKPIYQETDTLDEKMIKGLKFTAGALSPTAVYHAFNLKAALEGDVIGYPPFEKRKSVSQAVKRLFGISVYSGGRWAYEVKLNEWDKLINDLKTDYRRTKRDQNMDDEKKKELLIDIEDKIKKYRVLKSELRGKLQGYEQSGDTSTNVPELILPSR